MARRRLQARPPEPGPAYCPVLVHSPLSVYVHLPWCLSKCPYCDFNSYAKAGSIIDETAYVDALLADLAVGLTLTAGRPIETLFIGGGTPSLFSGEAIGSLLRGVAGMAPLQRGAEITLEANPGAVDARRFAAYREAGVNRLSIGVQSFDAGCLKRIGRIHGPYDAFAALGCAREAGFENVNLDLMFGLPGQTIRQARYDIDTIVSLNPEHVSYYQLTVEPDTAFSRNPPSLPDEDAVWEMRQKGHTLLEAAGYRRYEVSAYARTGRASRHNLNYWTYGDYLGIGAGAHSKLTLHDPPGVVRWERVPDPIAYLSGSAGKGSAARLRSLGESDLIFEFMMNALRLSDGFTRELFEQRTGLPFALLEPMLNEGVRQDLLVADETGVRPSSRGSNFLDELLLLFAPTA